MKITLNDFWQTVKNKIEPSVTIKNLWIARSMVAAKIHDQIRPLFGFAASFDPTQCEMRAQYELLEHIAFLPYFYNSLNIERPVNLFYEGRGTLQTRTIKEFLIGVKGFYGNGCAISSTKKEALDHSKRELFERHICCEIWYKGNRPLCPIATNDLTIIDPSIDLKAYSTDLPNDYFSLAVLYCKEIGFFALGASVKPTLNAAKIHAISEVVMLFEDAKKRKIGASCNDQSKQRILSLRNMSLSEERKKHFEKILNENWAPHRLAHPNYQAIIFEPFERLYAARTFSAQTSDPRNFEQCRHVPIMPLF